jgi:hypothetical protein
LNITAVSFDSILQGDITEAEFEFRSAIIYILVFRKIQIPPNIAIENIVKIYSKGLSKKQKLRALTVEMQTNHEHFGNWH